MFARAGGSGGEDTYNFDIAEAVGGEYAKRRARKQKKESKLPNRETSLQHRPGKSSPNKTVGSNPNASPPAIPQQGQDGLPVSQLTSAVDGSKAFLRASAPTAPTSALDKAMTFLEKYKPQSGSAPPAASLATTTIRRSAPVKRTLFGDGDDEMDISLSSGDADTSPSVSSREMRKAKPTLKVTSHRVLSAGSDKNLTYTVKEKKEGVPLRHSPTKMQPSTSLLVSEHLSISERGGLTGPKAAVSPLGFTGQRVKDRSAPSSKYHTNTYADDVTKGSTSRFAKESRGSSPAERIAGNDSSDGELVESVESVTSAAMGVCGQHGHSQEGGKKHRLKKTHSGSWSDCNLNIDRTPSLRPVSPTLEQRESITLLPHALTKDETSRSGMSKVNSEDDPRRCPEKKPRNTASCDPRNVETGQDLTHLPSRERVATNTEGIQRGMENAADRGRRSVDRNFVRDIEQDNDSNDEYEDDDDFEVGDGTGDIEIGEDVGDRSVPAEYASVNAFEIAKNEHSHRAYVSNTPSSGLGKLGASSNDNVWCQATNPALNKEGEKERIGDIVPKVGVKNAWTIKEECGVPVTALQVDDSETSTMRHKAQSNLARENKDDRNTRTKPTGSGGVSKGGIIIDRSTEVRNSEPLGQDIKIIIRNETVASVEYAHDPLKGLNLRSLGTQAVGSCAAVQANIAVLGMAGTKSAVDVVASSSGRRRSGNYHRQGEPRAAWGRLTHDLPANNFCSHVHHVPDAGKARRTPPMPSQRRPRSSAEMHAAGGTREGDSKTGNSDTERTGFRVDSSGDDQQSESWIPAGGGGTDGVRGDVTPMMGSSPPPPYVSAPPAYLEIFLDSMAKSQEESCAAWRQALEKTARPERNRSSSGDQTSPVDNSGRPPDAMNEAEEIVVDEGGPIGRNRCAGLNAIDADFFCTVSATQDSFRTQLARLRENLNRIRRRAEDTGRAKFEFDFESSIGAREFPVKSILRPTTRAGALMIVDPSLTLAEATALAQGETTPPPSVDTRHADLDQVSADTGSEARENL